MKTYTLGGNRLGAGKQRKVSVKAYERSTHNLSRILRDTMNVGTLVPFYCNVALPNDTWDIDLRSLVRTMPTNGPIFGSFKFQADMFCVPVRLYHGLLHNNALNIGKHMERVIFPTITLNSQYKDTKAINKDWCMVHPSSLLAHLGIKGTSETNTQFNAIPVLAYYDIYKNYFANTQETQGYVITPELKIVNVKIYAHYTDGGTIEVPQGILVEDWARVEYYEIKGITKEVAELQIKVNNETLHDLETNGLVTDFEDTTDGIVFKLVGFINAPEFASVATAHTSTMALTPFELTEIDNMRAELLRLNENEQFDIQDAGLSPYGALYGITNNISWNTRPCNGLVVKTYQSDLYNNWLNTEAIDEVNELTRVNTEDGMQINEFMLMYKTWEMLNAINVAGGTYKDYIEVNYDSDLLMAVEIPMYIGGMSGEIVFDEVISTADVTQDNNASQALGTIAGKGTMIGEKGGNITINVKEPSYIIGIMSITPRVDYNQGNKWHTYRIKTAADFHKPAMDEIGFEDLMACEMHWSEQRDPTLMRSIGKVPAWSNYTTDVNETLGDFADTLDFMVLNRHYDLVGAAGTGAIIKDATTYIDPRKYNKCFANTDLEAQNFWIQIETAAVVRRKMSARVMPHL